MSIIDPKYAEAYKNKPKDWLAKFLDEHATTPVTKTKSVKQADGSTTEETVETSKTKVDLDALFALSRANGVSEDKVTEMESQRDRKNAPGRIRMTLGNSLRAIARKRHGLNDVAGEFHAADAEFIGDNEKTENPDGSKIEKPKEEKAA